MDSGTVDIVQQKLYSMVTTIVSSSSTRYHVRASKCTFLKAILKADSFTWHMKHMLGLADYLYLLPGSNLTYSICLWTNQTLSTTSAEFLVFDLLLAYQNFIDGLADGRDTSIMQQQLKIGSTESPACSYINFMANKSAYYFMSADCPGGVTYQYNITSNVKYLNSTDYKNFPSCSVTEDESCLLVTDKSFFGVWKDVCLVAHVTASLPYSTDPPTTHVKVEIVKWYQLLVIPAVLIIIGILGILSMLLVVKFCKVTRRKGYEPIAWVMLVWMQLLVNVIM